jgi:C1A family cysteine protease
MNVLLKCLLLGSVLAFASAFAPVLDDLKNAFEKFKVDHKKSYKSQAEEANRFNQFSSVYRYVKSHNQKFNNAEALFEVGINRLADLSLADRKKFSTGNQLPPYDFNNFTVRPKEVITVTNTMFPPGPASVDWLKAGHVTPVKDQGFVCNSCWAFSVRNF